MIKEIFFTECGTRFVVELFTVLTIQPHGFMFSILVVVRFSFLYLLNVYILSVFQTQASYVKGASIEYLNINALRMSMID